MILLGKSSQPLLLGRRHIFLNLRMSVIQFMGMTNGNCAVTICKTLLPSFAKIPKTTKTE